MSNFSRLRKGDRVVVTNAIKPVGKGYNGATATVVKVFEKGDPKNDIHHLHFDDDALEKNNTEGGVIGTWSREALDLAPVPADEVAIDFSLDRYRTAREYAARAIGTKMKEQHQKTLRSASRGERVGLLDLNAAIADAYRQNATRYGQSPARRQGATELSHLQYIVQGALSNVIDGLPPVEPGARSPKIAALEADKQVLQTNFEASCRAVEAAEDNLRKEQRAHQAASKEIDRLKAEINEYETAFVTATEELEKVTAARLSDLSVIEYALDLLDEDLDRERLLGFWDAVEPGVRHDYDPQY